MNLPRKSRPAWWDDANDRAMLVCRISDRKQAEGVSLDAQRHNQEAYAERAGLRVVAVRQFQETAKRSNLRAQFHAAIEHARVEKIKHLVFYVYDRVARNFTDAEILEELIREGEVTLHIASGGNVLHRDSDDSEFFLYDINIAQAKQDNRARRRKTIDGMEQRCRNGWYPSRPPMFYWQELALDENGRPRRRGSKVAGPTDAGRRLVRREMELHFQGWSLDRIREKCIGEDIVPASLRFTYHRSTVEKHLKSEFFSAIPSPHDGYKSQFVWRGIRYEGKHEPIFSSEEWFRLQASFGLRAKQRKLKHQGLFAQGSLTLTCDDLACRCKITFAPKFKANGVVYRYYRCSDGRRLHLNRGEPQVNVQERSILDQLGAAVDAIQITGQLADEIARGLHETHRSAAAARSKGADGLREEIRVLEEKEDRLFDRLDKGEIDRETYERQLARVRADKRGHLETLQSATKATDEAAVVTAWRVLELAKNARSLWEGRKPEEQRDLLARLVCNPRLEGRTVRYDLRKPFAILSKMRGVEGWRPQRESNPSNGHFA